MSQSFYRGHPLLHALLFLTCLGLISGLSNRMLLEDDGTEGTKWTPKLSLKNYGDQQYTFEIGLGKVDGEINWVNVHYDTSTDSSWFAPIECEKCPTTERADTSGIHVDSRSRVFAFDNAHIHGYSSTADIFLSENENHALRNFHCLVARKMDNFRHLYGSGAIGGAHANKKGDLSHTLIQALYQRELISEKVVTFHYTSAFASEPESSWVMFGEASTLDSNGNYEYLTRYTDGQEWFTTPVTATIGNTSLDLIESFIHTGASSNWVSKGVRNKIMNEIRKSEGYQEGDEKYCLISKFPVFKVTFKSVEYHMKPEDYIGYDPKTGECWLNFEQKVLPADDVIVLGAPFMRKVNLVLDYSNNKVAIAKSKSSSPVIPEGKRPFVGSWGFWFLMIILVGVGSVGGVYYAKKKNLCKKNDHARMTESKYSIDMPNISMASDVQSAEQEIVRNFGQC